MKSMFKSEFKVPTSLLDLSALGGGEFDKQRVSFLMWEEIQLNVVLKSFEILYFLVTFPKTKNHRW